MDGALLHIRSGEVTRHLPRERAAAAVTTENGGVDDGDN